MAKLVYSTCSLEPEENEQVARLVLDGSPDLRPMEEKRSLPFRDDFDGAFAEKFIRSCIASAGCVRRGRWE